MFLSKWQRRFGGGPMYRNPLRRLPAFRDKIHRPFLHNSFRAFLPAGLILGLLTIQTASSQESLSTRSVMVEDLIEKIARETEQELDYQTLFEDLYQYLESPLNLNTASREELEKLQLLTDFQIGSLQDYIRENGPLLSIYELPLVYGFDEALARTIEPLVVAGPPERSPPEGRLKSSHDLLLRVSSVLEQQEGYAGISDSALALNPNARYLGNRLRLVSKYRYRLGDRIQAGYNGDKDAGEPFFTGENRQGFDFNSAYIRINDLWKFRTIVAGDYQVRTGQGLGLWSGLAFGKSPDIINIRKKGSPLAPYSSVEENRFFRGMAATIRIKDLEITAFVSHKKIDVNLVDTLDGQLRFSSFQSTGYHRIPGEFEDKDAVNEMVAGGHLAWTLDRLQVGATLLHSRYNAGYLVPGQDISAPGSEENTNIGINYLLVLNRASFFGEAAGSLDPSGGDIPDRASVLNGASFELYPGISMSVLHRYLGRGYNARFGNAFRENNLNANENGIYTGVEIHPIPRWRLTAYLDAYRFPFLAELFAENNYGYDYHLQADYAGPEDLSAYLRFRHKSRPKNLNPGGNFSAPLSVPASSQLRFHLSYRVLDGLRFQDRLELSFFQEEAKEGGWLAYHDILFKSPVLPLSFSFRYCMFDTESYNTRIYTYEHDVLYAFAIPYFYGRGIRTYLNARLDLGRHADLWFKYALSWYPERETISSGLNEIRGHHRQDVSVQIRVKF